MDESLTILVAFVGAGLGLWLVSHVVEALRPAPEAPDKLSWAPDIAIQYMDIAGVTLRYIKTGAGPTLVLLHTLRTQLDLFEKVVPDLAKHFTVYALDYPGHGYSDIPKGKYDADFFVAAVERFLDTLGLRDVTLCGVSIGGAIALIMAGRRDPRVTRVVAINSYDYAKGRGMARSALLARMIVVTSQIPVIGETIMRLRNFSIMKATLCGGVADPASIPSALMREMYQVGNRRGHYRAFVLLLRNAASWDAATAIYGNIAVPVLLIWGDKDWARPSERARDRALVPGAKVDTIANGGHFLPLDQPLELLRLIIGFNKPSTTANQSKS